MPISSSSVITTQLTSCWITGVKLVIINIPIFPRFLNEIIEKEGVTLFSCTPQYLKVISNERLRSKYSLMLRTLKVIIVSGAALDPTIYSLFKSLFPHIEVLQSYGLTEAGPRVSIMRKGANEISCGYPVENVKISIKNRNITNDNNNIGEVLVKSPSLMEEYLNNPSETKRVINNGWLSTGDIGYIKEGRLILVGRAKNTILISGNTVYAEEIEGVLKSYPEINEAVVISQSNSTFGEVPIAFLVVKDKPTFTEEKLLRFCRDNLATYKIPRSFIVLEEIPYNRNEKVDRVRLHELYNDYYKK
jgi:long-chain acyl-CoA synthetase